MTVRIVTDSACDLPDEVVAEHGVRVVPLSIRFGDTEMIDREELSVDRFWELCAAGDQLPSTAAPSPGAFEQAYRGLAAEGADGVVAVVLSAKLSATIEAARQAATAVADTITVEVVDSESITLGLGSMVVAAAERAGTGASVAEVAAHTRDLVERTLVLGALDTLDNLRKGGRIGAAQAVLGGVLQVKPIIEIRDGEVAAAGRQRTRRKALDHVVGRVGEMAEAGRIERLSVMHADCDDVDAFVARVRPYAPGDVLVGRIGPVIGAHAGRGTIGVILQLGAPTG